MINGAHAILYSDDADATRATLAKVLGTRSVDAGGGWLIFALPPAELAVHPAEEGGRVELYLLCDDVAATVAALQAEGIEIARPISDQGWGLLTAISLPGGMELGPHQPRHPTAAQPTSVPGSPSEKAGACLPPALVTGLQHSRSGWAVTTPVDQTADPRVWAEGASRGRRVSVERDCSSPRPAHSQSGRRLR
jgi:hypothetical protein